MVNRQGVSRRHHTVQNQTVQNQKDFQPEVPASELLRCLMLSCWSFGESLPGASPAKVAWSYRWDVIMLVGLFVGLVFGLRALMEKLSPRYIEMNGLAHDIGRWISGLIGGYVTMAFLLTALHTAPLQRNFMEFRPERANLFGIIAPDRQWLGFTQYASESLFASGRIFDGPVSDFIDDQADDNRNTIWPSFPIRYASRREKFEAGGLIAAPTVAPAESTIQQGSGSGAAGF